jgi:alginate O-acetyltransferase complex protein AlgI
LLGFFKYSNFVLDNVWSVLTAFGAHLPRQHLDIILPPGISFYTFASISYVIDVYYERIPACQSARDYTLFVTFFPKVLSGPIVRASELLPQLRERARVSARDIEIGLSYLMLGAVKKLVIADQIADHVNLIFAAPGHYDARTLLLGALGYTTQIYCDFSGYSDMAIGCARMMGFRFPENFQMPFSSATITEFWRRWHITMSMWFRDYLFFPLEIATRDNPSPTLRLSINMMTTMLLCGLWHGASWTFVLWGGIHGAALSIHKVWSTMNPLRRLKTAPIFRYVWNGISHLLTLAVIVLGMIFFRAQSVPIAISYLSRLLSWAHDGARLSSPYLLGAIGVVTLVHLIIGKDRNLALELPEMRLAPRMIGYATLLLALALFGASNAASFIYFQF